MAPRIFLLCLLVLCYGCSPDATSDDLPASTNNLEVTLTPSMKEVHLDQPFILKVKSTEGLYEISRILEGRVQAINPLMEGDKLDDASLDMHLQFSSLGAQEVVLEFISISGKKLKKTVNFDVKRGDAVKITGFRINSFYNIHGTWDDEFGETDINRLADVQFGFGKTSLAHFNNPQPQIRPWYLSPVYPNEQQLEWDLSAEELYIGNTSFLRVGIMDADDQGISQDLARDFSDLILRLRDYKDSKPPEIHMVNQEYGFDITFSLEWL